jgi:transposase InsO family protein
MNENERKIRARENWLKTYQDLGSITKASIKLGVSRSTLYRWKNRYNQEGKSGLSDKSRRPKNLANQKVDLHLEEEILTIRKKRNWGPQRISTFLLRKKGIELSPMTIWRVLSKHNVKPVLKRRKKSDYKRYNKSIPGERVQMDVTKLRPKAYQFTAIDDCTRLKVIRIYPNKRADSAVEFLGEVLDSFPFPVQRVQTDWGTEFFNFKFQEELHEHFIKFRPIKPKSPHLNGKVERTQQTDKSEFWRLLDLTDLSLDLKLLAMEWETFYNHKRPHSSLGGKTPWQKYREVEKTVPIQPEVTDLFWESKEQVYARNAEFWVLIKKKNNSLKT